MGGMKFAKGEVESVLYVLVPINYFYHPALLITFKIHFNI